MLRTTDDICRHNTAVCFLVLLAFKSAPSLKMRRACQDNIAHQKLTLELAMSVEEDPYKNEPWGYMFVD